MVPKFGNFTVTLVCQNMPQVKRCDTLQCHRCIVYFNKLNDIFNIVINTTCLNFRLVMADSIMARSYPKTVVFIVTWYDNSYTNTRDLYPLSVEIMDEEAWQRREEGRCTIYSFYTRQNKCFKIFFFGKSHANKISLFIILHLSISPTWTSSVFLRSTSVSISSFSFACCI